MAMEDKAWRATPTYRQHFNSTRLVGVEWEYNNCGSGYNTYGYATNLQTRKPLSRWLKKWKAKIKNDGSCGYEVVSAPLSGDYIAESLRALGKAFIDSQAVVDKRCSIHVHVSCKDFTWQDMYRLLWVYSQVETILFWLGGKERTKSHWCRPCGQAYRKAVSYPEEKIQDKVLTVAYSTNKKCDKIEGYFEGPSDFAPNMSGTEFYRRYCERRAQGRYKALNLCPWLSARKGNKKGMTVEFRLHKFAKPEEAEDVIQWVQLLVQLVDWAKNATDDEAKQLPQNALLALHMIAPKSRRWIRQRGNKWGKDIYQL